MRYHEQNRQITAYLPIEVWAKVKEIVEKEGRKMSEYIREAVTEKVDKK